MKKIMLLAAIVLVSCHQNKKQAKNEDFVATNIKNWKNQLLMNGEVGQPCQDNTEQWSEQFPERYYGLPKESIKSKIFDANNDKINDVLLYFPAGNCCSCTIGMNEGSDFVKLIYSNGKDFLTNDNLRDKITLKIENEFYRQTNTDVERAIFSITDFNTNIEGTYQLWTLEDPDCCASNGGTFKYNPFTFKIEIHNQIIKNGK